LDFVNRFKNIVNNDKRKFPYACRHIDCSHRFKTKKQRIVHHNRVEKQCKTEKHMLIKLIRHYKVALTSLVNKGMVDTTSENYLRLKKVYKATENASSDFEYFYCLLGRDSEEVLKVDLKREKNNEIDKVIKNIE
jgi:hypothetical protein